MKPTLDWMTLHSQLGDVKFELLAALTVVVLIIFAFGFNNVFYDLVLFYSTNKYCYIYGDLSIHDLFVYMCLFS